MSGRLDGKVAIVTGSTTGIGRATATLFAHEGARVVVNGRSADKGARVVEEIRGASFEASFVHADVTHVDELQALIRYAVSTYGQLDVLVNNAFSAKGGPLSATDDDWDSRFAENKGSILEIDEENWDTQMAVSVRAVYLGSRFAVPEMLRTGGGSIINVSSVHGLLAARRCAAYEAAKGSILSLTRQMAVDFGPQSIRVNAICPGWVIVERVGGIIREDPEIERRATRVYPLRRAGRPVDIARAALFLASEESSFITGQNLK